MNKKNDLAGMKHVGDTVGELGYPNLCVHSSCALKIDKMYMEETQGYKMC
jgi:hypothetical protein